MSPKFTNAILIVFFVSAIINWLITFEGCSARQQRAAQNAALDASLKELHQRAAVLEDKLAKYKSSAGLTDTKSHSGYLDELERLDALRTSGAITGEEFVQKKHELLALKSPAAPIPPSAITSNALQMPELAKQLRLLLELYQNNTINSVERDEKKRQVIAKPLMLVDLKSDLELVTALFNENVITSPERDELKKKLLQDSPIAK